MTELSLQRTSRTQYGTFGEISGPDGHECFTLEPAGDDNAHDTSCIPAGTYRVTLMDPTEKFPYRHYAVNDVPDRQNVRMHRGNWAKDTEGCILVGTSQTAEGVWSSEIALYDLLAKYPEGFDLTISEVQ